MGVMRPVLSAVSWYTYDFVARRRICRSCGWSASTVEITVEDLREMLDEASAGNYSPAAIDYGDDEDDV